MSNRDSARRTRQRKLEETRDLQTQVWLSICYSSQQADFKLEQGLGDGSDHIRLGNNTNSVVQVDQLKADNIRLSQQVADLTKANEALVSSIPLIGEQNR